mmetsp:Transcript_1861/g.2636  ORF Transcript_1861/g.2636 Transcript_1861/m.2636 type:complete len:93 (+) Transcript_1861:971-1249(+)
MSFDKEVGTSALLSCDIGSLPHAQQRNREQETLPHSFSHMTPVQLPGEISPSRPEGSETSLSHNTSSSMEQSSQHDLESLLSCANPSIRHSQ